MRKNIPFLVGVPCALIVGVIIGSFVLSSPQSNASVLDDLKNLFGGGSTQEEQRAVSPFRPENSYEQEIVSAVQSAAPAVVSVVVSKDVPVIEQCPSDPFSGMPQEFRQFFGGRGLQFSVPCQRGTEKREIGGGSGFFVSSDGYILTNKHVVDDKDAEYTVLTNDGKKYDAKILARHPSLDIAVIKINGSGFPTVKLGDSNGIQLGQTAIAIGNSLGEFRNTVSVGIVSGLARSVTAQSFDGEAETIENVIQTDAAINPGNSGGPLLNSAGEVIGINTAMVSGAQSIGFAIPINGAKKSMQSVQDSGDISAAYLGVRYVMIDETVREKYKLSASEGALVIGDGQNFAVEQGSPADKAGIKEGDILTSISGQKIDIQHSPASIISEKNPGDSAIVTLLRNGRKISVSVVFGKRTQ